MTNKVYRTAQGRIVDLGMLEAQNEHVRAVGNMKVNARGDKLDANGNIISTRSQQVNRNLGRATNAAAGSIPASSRAQKEADAAAVQAAEQAKIEQARAQRQALREQGAAPPVASPAAGLAAAMARAATITDEE
jgi:protein involved in temperature-dependent protein secretion